MSGSGGDTGYDYQANAIAYIASHGLTEQPLGWFEGHTDIVSCWRAETAGPGDDIAVTTLAGETIEIQAKHGLVRGSEYLETFRKLLAGLHTQSQLRTVLLVDRHASSVIRDELKADIERLGQGRSDGLKAITVDLLSDLQETPVSSIFSRLRIVVVDLDLGSDGISVILSLLSQIVPRDRSTTAYELLGKRGHSLIKGRGQDDVLHCARYLDTAIGLLPSESLSTVPLARFVDFVQMTNAHFYSPALERQFPITSAWAKVSRLGEDPDGASQSYERNNFEKELKRYQEWTRLAASKRRVDEIEAELLAESQRRLAIVGGPGSGKTTLSKKLAHIASRNHIAIRVRLPLIAVRLREGAAFEAALVEAVTDSSTLTSDAGRKILNAAEYLIADGLDECDPSRADIAESLVRWATSHPLVRICVLTRPVGHNPSLLPGFTHAELLPLEEYEVREIAFQLITSHVKDETAQTNLTHAFMKMIGAASGNPTASIAARNPLLLSFLVRLYLDKEPLSGNRAQLFGRIIELIRRSSPSEHLLSSGASPDYATAWRTAEFLGWSAIEKPERPTDDLYALIATHLGGGISNLRAAEVAVHLWSDHGLIERITVGSRDAIVFVHLSLGEYLAGRYLAGADTDFINAEIVRSRRRAKWREPILFAAASGASEAIVHILLSLDTPNDPQSAEAVLAAACLAEMSRSDISPTLTQEVASKLKCRLCSPIPLIAMESGEALLNVAPLIPEFVAEISLDLWDHEQSWTRMAGICPGLSTGSKKIPIDRVVQWLSDDRDNADESDSVKSFFRIPVGYELRKAAIPKALKRVAAELPTGKAETIVVDFLSQAHISMGILEEVRATLTESPCKAWVEKAYSLVTKGLSHRDFLAQMLQGQERSRLGEVVLLNCVVALGEPGKEVLVAHTPDRFLELGTLFSSMGYWEMVAGDLIPLEDSVSPELIEVLRGISEGLKLDFGRLRVEATLMLERLKAPNERLWLIPKNKQEPDWDLTRKSSTNVRLLAKALEHPSQLLAWNATRLLNGRTYADIERANLREQFLGAKRNLRLWGALAPQIWGDEAFSILRARLATCQTVACGELYAPLISVSKNDEELLIAVQLIVEAVGSPTPKLAERAAEALRSVDSRHLSEHCREFTRLLTLWKDNGSWCSYCQKSVMGRSCPTCHVVPPSPRKHLVFLLAKVDCVSLEDLFALAGEYQSDVAEEAQAAIVGRAQENPEVLQEVFSAINQGSVALLNKLLKQSGSQMQTLSAHLRRLLQSKDPTVRARVINSLNDGWASPDEARRIAEVFISDEAPSVRSAAVRSLRQMAERLNLHLVDSKQNDILEIG